jgi:hypothetical protein
MNGLHELQSVLEAALETDLVLPERKLRSLEAFVEMFPGVERVMMDGTERRFNDHRMLKSRP